MLRWITGIGTLLYRPYAKFLLKIFFIVFSIFVISWFGLIWFEFFLRCKILFREMRNNAKSWWNFAKFRQNFAARETPKIANYKVMSLRQFHDLPQHDFNWKKMIYRFICKWWPLCVQADCYEMLVGKVYYAFFHHYSFQEMLCDKCSSVLPYFIPYGAFSRRKHVQPFKQR